MIRVHEFAVPPPGPRLLFFGAIHGNEVCGPRALERLREELDSGRLELLRGTLTCVPVCNPEAYRLGTRLAEKNLNRVFERHADPSSYEARLANLLVPLLERADVFVDLHSMTSKGEPFVFLNRENAASRALCRALGPVKIMTGWPEIYDGLPGADSSCTQTYADRLGKPNALIECGTHGTPEADAVAYAAIRGALAHLGMATPLAPPAAPVANEVLRLVEVVFRESAEDVLVGDFHTFDAVARGQVLARRGGRDLCSPVDGVIVFPNPITPVGTELYYVAVRET